MDGEVKIYQCSDGHIFCQDCNEHTQVSLSYELLPSSTNILDMRREQLLQSEEWQELYNGEDLTLDLLWWWSESYCSYDGGEYRVGSLYFRFFCLKFCTLH